KKLAKAISPEDRLRVELLGQVREAAKGRLPNPAARKSAVYRVLEDDRIASLLRRGRFDDARAAAEGIMGRK
ncbi:MAG: hypothetical protein JRN24_04055, partial [Nitrososphaerota archaeon]|nr:hypothetical protein [Nitrososphaerota archaeon]